MAMALKSTASDAEVVYFDELKHITTKLKVLRQRVKRAEREARKAVDILWAHVGDLKHINELLKEVLEFEFGHFKHRKP